MIRFPFLFAESRLTSVEDFESQREQLEKTIETLNGSIIEKENCFRAALDQMEMALIRFKDRFVERKTKLERRPTF